jgi:hypothetical protein
MNELQQQSVCGGNLIGGDRADVNEADGLDEFAEMDVVFVWEEVKIEPGSKPKDIGEKFLGFISTVNFLSDITRRAIE